MANFDYAYDARVLEYAERGLKIAGDSVIFGKPVDPYSLRHVLALLAILVETPSNLLTVKAMQEKKP